MNALNKMGRPICIECDEELYVEEYKREYWLQHTYKTYCGYGRSPLTASNMGVRLQELCSGCELKYDPYLCHIFADHKTIACKECYANFISWRK